MARRATLIRAHAEAMKAVDPSLLAFFNENSLSPKALTKFLAEVGPAIDGAEFHGKWPYGGSPPTKPPAATYDDWLQQVPLRCHRTNTSWRDRIAGLRTAAREAGRPDLLLANNEFGLGKPPSMVGFSRYAKSMVVVEFAMEMFVGGFDVAAFWDNGDGHGQPKGDGESADEDTGRMLLDTQAAYRMNPMHIGLAMLFAAANTTMVNVTSSAARVHGFASRDDGGGGTLRVYLMNKFEVAKPVSIALPPAAPPLAAAASMVDSVSADGWGEVTPTTVSCDAGRCDVTLPPVSFTMLHTY